MLPGNRFSSTDSGSHKESQWYTVEEADLFVLRVSRVSGDVVTGVVMWLLLLFSRAPEEAEADPMETSEDGHTASELTNRVSDEPFAVVAADAARTAAAVRDSAAADCQWSHPIIRWNTSAKLTEPRLL